MGANLALVSSLLAAHTVALGTTCGEAVETCTTLCTGHYFLRGDLRVEPRLPRRLPVPLLPVL